MDILKALVGAVALSFTAGFAHSASSDWVSSGDTRMRLVVAEPLSGETRVRAALQVDLAPGWKTYWRDPGDAGVPLQLDASGSQNVALKEIHYPTPKRFDDGVTVWAGYDQPVLFPLELDRTDTTLPGALTASIFIGICDKICVPFQTTLSVSFDNASASTPDQMLVEGAFNALPRPSDGQSGVLSIAVQDKTVRIETMLAEGNPASELYLAAPQGWQFSAPKLINTDGGKATFEATVLFAPEVIGKISPLVHYTLLNESIALSGESVLGE